MIKTLCCWGCLLLASTIGYRYIIAMTKYPVTPVAHDARNIDTHVVGVQYRQYDANGYLAQYLTTPLLIHQPNTSTHRLSKPHIMIHEDGKKPWEIRADYAIASEGGKQIAFYDNVRILQKKDDNPADNTLLQTQNLRYIPQQQIASTHSAVRITQGGNAIQATGLIADLKTHTIRLLSDVRGHYVQNTQ